MQSVPVTSLPAPSRGSILLRPKRPGAGRINEETLDKQWEHEQRVLADKIAERSAAERERERWGHQHEFDREEMHQRMAAERDSHLALKEQTKQAEQQLDRELSDLPEYFAKHIFEHGETVTAQRREEARQLMEENARLMRERLEIARAAKLTEVADDAAAGDEFIERFTKPSWREQAKYAKRTSALVCTLPDDERPLP
jgi:hypothetical protein